jgi:hypothetical protein
MLPLRALLALLCAASLASCGDKVPESEAAKKLGAQPRQVIDKAAADVQKALQQGAERRSDAEKKD